MDIRRGGSRSRCAPLGRAARQPQPGNQVGAFLRIGNASVAHGGAGHHGGRTGQEARSGVFSFQTMAARAMAGE